MPLLRCSPLNGRRVEVRVWAASGDPLAARAVDRLSDRDQRWVATVTGLPAGEVIRVLDRAAAGPVEVEVPGPLSTGSTEGPLRAVLRGLRQKRSEGRLLEAADPVALLRLALSIADYPAAEPVIEWDGTELLCCLDIDYHSLPLHERPSDARLAVAVRETRPVPVAWHRSHGRGAKLYYTATGDYTAAELAAAAALLWSSRDRVATFELKSASRHPAYPRAGAPAGPVQWLEPSDDPAGAFRAWLRRDATVADAAGWLAERGWQEGDRLDHEHCPIDPGHRSHGQPVFVGQLGILCHRCQASGLGLSTPGFVPWSVLLGGVESNVELMLRNFTHWDHARLVLEHYCRLRGETLRAAYTAALKLLHSPDDERVGFVFHPALTGIVRVDGDWASIDGSVAWGGDRIRPIYRRMPATCKLGDDGKPRSDEAIVTVFGTPGKDLLQWGYPALTPVRGVRIYGQRLAYPDGRLPFVSPAREFVGEFAPRYRPPTDRLALTAARAVLERTFPGINFEYLAFLIALKGIAESGTAQSPFALVVGPSGSAKSTTVHVAASICGDRVTEVVWTDSSERLRQSIKDGSDRGSFLVLNEFYKDAARSRTSPRAILDTFLGLTPDSTSHKLYTGPIRMGAIPATVLTDVMIPSELAQDPQISRRFVLVELQSRVDWAQSILAAGLSRPSLWRTRGKEEAAAADAILSWVVDELFDRPRTVPEIGAHLGLPMLEDAARAEEDAADARRLFELVDQAPPLTGSDAARYTGPGWKVIDRTLPCELTELWSGRFADGDRGDEWSRSRRAAALDWSRVLGAEPGIVLDVNGFRGSKVYLRFRRGTSRKPTAVNGEVLRCSG
jgi:hypothetical protein